MFSLAVQEGMCVAHLLDAEDEVGDVDEALQRAKLLGGARAGAGLEAAAHDAAADVDVHWRSILVREAQRLLKCPDPVRLIPPGIPTPVITRQLPLVLMWGESE